MHSINAGVPLGNILGPLPSLHQRPSFTSVRWNKNWYICWQHSSPIRSQFSSKCVIPTPNLSEYLVRLINWRIKANEISSIQVTFTLKHERCSQFTLNSIPIPQSEEAKYLGIHLDKHAYLSKQKHWVSILETDIGF